MLTLHRKALWKASLYLSLPTGCHVQGVLCVYDAWHRIWAQQATTDNNRINSHTLDTTELQHTIFNCSTSALVTNSWQSALSCTKTVKVTAVLMHQQQSALPGPNGSPRHSILTGDSQFFCSSQHVSTAEESWSLELNVNISNLDWYLLLIDLSFLPTLTWRAKRASLCNRMHDEFVSTAK